jgi:hypothetical protein
MTSASPASNSITNSGSGVGLIRTRARQSALCRGLEPGLSIPATATSLKTVCGTQHWANKAGSSSSWSISDNATSGPALMTAHSIIRSKLSAQLIIIEGYHRHPSAPGRQQKFHPPHAAKLPGFARTQAADLEQFERQHEFGLTCQRRRRSARRSQRIQRKFKRHCVHNSALQVSAEALFLIMAQAVIP